VKISGQPLDITFGGTPERIYVTTGRTAAVAEIDPETGSILSTLDAEQPTEAIKVVHGRWLIAWHYWMSDSVAVWDLRDEKRTRRTIRIGTNIGDVTALDDNESVVISAVQSQVVKRVHLPDARVTGTAKFKRGVGRLVPVLAHGRPAIAVMGGIFRMSMLSGYSAPAGAWVDLINPDETPFGASRRSLSAGVQPRTPGVTSDGGRLLFPDRMSNQVTLVQLDSADAPATLGVGVRPEEVVVFPGDRHAVSLDNGSSSLTIIALAPFARESTIPLTTPPTAATSSTIGGYVAVALGGKRGEGQGVILLAGEPPRIAARAVTGRGPSAIATSANGNMLATANVSGSVTLFSVTSGGACESCGMPVVKASGPTPASAPIKVTAEGTRSSVERIAEPIRASASSTHAAGLGYTFSPSNLLDGDLATSWQPANSRGPTWFRLDFEHEVIVTSIQIANGLQTEDSHGDEFLLNSRIANGRIRFSDGAETPINFTAGDRAPTRFEVASKPTRSVTVLVDSVHRGSRWNDLAVSEVQVRYRDATTTQAAP